MVLSMKSNYSEMFGIIPPYIIRAIEQNSNEEEERNVAKANLKFDNEFREQRAATSEVMSKGDVYINRECIQKQRFIYDADKSLNPMPLVRSEGSVTVNDVAVNEAYDGFGAAYDFFCHVFRRNSIDNHGLPLKGVVHYKANFYNAFWDPVETRVLFGDGDGKRFNRFTIALEVIGHELTHAIIAHEGGLAYTGQTGALNESIADVFGSLLKQYHLGQTHSEADWLVGVGIFTNQVQGEALRSMKAPRTAFDDKVLGKDPQPAHMKGFVTTRRDHGGVHINSGIPNRAFYLAAKEIGGNAWDRAGLIWYNTLCDKTLKLNINFKSFANRTLKHADILFGSESHERKAVKAAWVDVGILA